MFPAHLINALENVAVVRQSLETNDLVRSQLTSGNDELLRIPS